MKKQNGGPKRTEFEREHDYRIISDLYLQGETQTEIAAKLGVSQAQISMDLATIQRRWRTETTLNMDEAKQKELARIDNLERVHWGGWKRSQLEQVRTRTEQIKSTEKAKGQTFEKLGQAKAVVEKETPVGDPRYLDGVIKCIDRRCKLLGLDAAVTVDIDWQKEAQEAGQNVGELFENLVATIAAITDSTGEVIS